jgi:hypothetical protein
MIKSGRLKGNSGLEEKHDIVKFDRSKGKWNQSDEQLKAEDGDCSYTASRR